MEVSCETILIFHLEHEYLVAGGIARIELSVGLRVVEPEGAFVVEGGRADEKVPVMSAVDVSARVEEGSSLVETE
jgi:hypothetical protein